MIKRILFATDFSRWARRAEDYACALACSWRASLTVLSVAEFMPGLNPDYPVNQQYLAELLKQASSQLVDLKGRAERRGIAVTTRMATGIPSEEVITAARAEDSDLVVVGTKGKTGLEHVLLGSTAERVIRGAPCPVLTVRTEQPLDTDQEEGDLSRPVTLERILVPVDFSDCSLDALEYAVVVAQQAEASLMLLHVLEPVSYGLDFTLGHIRTREQLRESWTKRLEELASSHQQSHVQMKSGLRGGLPVDSILDSAQTLPCDLIVMGTHGRRGISHAFSGSVAEAVLRKARCPVLTVRSPKFGPGHRRVTPTAMSPVMHT
ncbi:MAG: universal stress protein [Nitrospirae bacterium]|nr:universal stress protein [Nitrospirota bacterium]MDE3041155.1 universal stress protein [Nitrospirota bacterium]MDE3050122.1 universal stress protein [Nitrospirota bacterium]MDE3217957.1 universal stress protein [Nitrospirota bacterium]